MSIRWVAGLMLVIVIIGIIVGSYGNWSIKQDKIIGNIVSFALIVFICMLMVGCVQFLDDSEKEAVRLEAENERELDEYLEKQEEDRRNDMAEFHEYYLEQQANLRAELAMLEDCNIKWNISFHWGEKIYHLPWCPDYKATKINTEYWERWFCSEEEAINASWRRAYNCGR